MSNLSKTGHSLFDGSSGAFGVDPTQPHRYRLRHSRYAVLAQDINDWAGEAALAGRTLSVLDVGCGWGPLLRHLEPLFNFDNIRISATDLRDAAIYKKELYREYIVGDLTGEYPEIPSDAYDVVVCEQVLEHLDVLDGAIATLERMVRPGGTLVLGVPIFLPPLHLARKYVVSLFRHSATASHVRAFSLGSFLRELRKYPNLTVVKARGFRIISGGLLRPLENHRWWWQLNRRLGEWIPAACIEVQVILEKSKAR